MPIDRIAPCLPLSGALRKHRVDILSRCACVLRPPARTRVSETGTARTAMLQDADRLHERLPARTPARFTVDTGTLAGYAMMAYSASSYIWLGDYKAARKHAEAAIAIHEEAPAHSASPSRKAIARIELGIALAHLGNPDQAVELGHRALASSRVVDSVRNRVGDLQAVLVPRYPDAIEVRGFRECCQRLKRSATVGGEG